jgi:phage repressor protein C with HTH and peptisase S24 domain
LVERLLRPASLAGDAQAYAITIVGEGMWPRFRPGRKIAVAPRSSVAIGDEVLLRLKPPLESPERVGAAPALVAQLAGRTNEQLELLQFNPNATFGIDAAEVESIHKIAGELF